jgi:hypothetical protein
MCRSCTYHHQTESAERRIMGIIKPNFYKQFDSRWAGKSWRGCTMSAYACGEMSVCNIASALTQHSLTPPQVWNYATSHGFMCPGAGTYWSGIDTMLKHYGISVVEQTHDRTKLHDALRQNYWAITIMHRGIWTSAAVTLSCPIIATQTAMSTSV